MVVVEEWPFFQVFFLGNIGQENVFKDILERKNSILAYKNKKFKKSKNWHFSYMVNPWFWSENGHFSKLFFRRYWAGKCLLLYSRTKKRLSRLTKQQVKKVENGHFFKGGKPLVCVQKWRFFQLFFYAI